MEACLLMLCALLVLRYCQHDSLSLHWIRLSAPASVLTVVPTVHEYHPLTHLTSTLRGNLHVSDTDLLLQPHSAPHVSLSVASLHNSASSNSSTTTTALETSICPTGPRAAAASVYLPSASVGRVRAPQLYRNALHHRWELTWLSAITILASILSSYILVVQRYVYSVQVFIAHAVTVLVFLAFEEYFAIPNFYFLQLVSSKQQSGC
uniref:Uncharacterized protein n=1 Tax=Lygus hesperus TaxID=30085 RepID=A0A146L4D0_LYGHE